jgi:hypothetical protein
MKRKLILIVALALVLCGMTWAGEPNVPVIEPDPVQGITIWGLTEADADSTLEGRIGFELESRFEPFVGVKYLTGNPEWGPAPDIVSGGMIYHVNEIGLVADPAPDNAWEEILHSLKARPYGGLEVAIPTQGEQRQLELNYIVGTLFSNKPDFRVSFCVEYIVGDDDQVFRIGGRFRW